MPNPITDASPNTTQAKPDIESPAFFAKSLEGLAPEQVVAILTGEIAQVEVEAVVNQTLMRLTFKEGTNPAEILPKLKALDPGVKVRDAFPMRGSFGSKETKETRCVVINARITDNGKFIDLVCQNGDDISVAVSKKKADDFLGELTALAKLSEKNIKKVADAFEAKSAATVILGEAEQFGVKYWSTDDGKHFMDSMMHEPPAHVDDKKEEAA